MALEAEIDRLQLRIQSLETCQAQKPEDKTTAQLSLENRKYERDLSDLAMELICLHFKKHGIDITK